MKIQIEPTSLKLSASSDSATGKIWIESGTDRFPEAGWSDLVFPILDMWTDAWYELKSRRVSRCMLHFMDGPFGIGLSFSERSTVYVEFVDRTSMQTIGHEFISAVDLERCLFAAVEQFLDWTERNKIENKGTFKLGKKFAGFADGMGC